MIWAASEARRRRPVHRGILWWLPPSLASFIYTVLLRPRLLRRLAQRMIRMLIPERLEIDGITLVLNPEDAIVSGNLALGCYETFNIEFFTALLRPSMFVMDVGANIGLYSAIASRHVGESGRVIAIEPSVENCRFIERTREFNRLGNLEIVGRAASDVSGPGVLYLNRDNKADHRIFDRTGRRPRVAVTLTTIDDLASELGLGRIDLLKIDVQGAEAAVFRGMSALLARSLHCRIFMEFWPWGIERSGNDPAKLLEMLLSKELVLYVIDGNACVVRRVSHPQALLTMSKERHHVDLFLARADDPLLAEPTVRRWIV